MRVWLLAALLAMGCAYTPADCAEDIKLADQIAQRLKARFDHEGKVDPVKYALYSAIAEGILQRGCEYAVQRWGLDVE